MNINSDFNFDSSVADVIFILGAVDMSVVISLLMSSDDLLMGLVDDLAILIKRLITGQSWAYCE